MKTTTRTARRLLRESNPVPVDRFAGAARSQSGQARLAAILASPATSPQPGDPDGRGRVLRRRPAPARSRWRAATPAAVALTAGLAVTLMLTSGPGPGPGPRADQPGGGIASLVADLTAHPRARPGGAAAVFSRLADAAAAQPSPGLGPVEYAESKGWGLDLGTLHYNLSYRSHVTDTQQSWMGPDGASLDVTTYPGGKIPPGIIPVHRSGPSKRGEAAFAWYNPARLPAGEAALRQHLLDRPGGFLPPVCRPGQAPGGRTEPSSGGNAASGGAVSPACQDPVTAIVNTSVELMGGEPLPPAVRASLLRLLADTVRASGPDASFIDMGTVTDRAGHTAVAIGFQTPAAAPAPVSLQVLVFDPATGALLGEEYAYCQGRVGSYPAGGRCFPTSYAQLLQVKAVPAIPATPAPSPSDSP